MTVFQTMAATQLLMFLYLLTGIVLSRAGVLKEAGRAGLMALLIDVVMPAPVRTPYAEGLTLSELASGFSAMAVSLAGCLLSWRLGCLLWRGEPEGRREPLIYGTMLPNLGNAGLPICQLVFGGQGVFITSMMMLPSTVVGWTVGPAIYRRQGGWRQALVKVLTNPNIVAIFIGVLLTLTGLPLPGTASRAVTGFAGMAAPLSMVLVGSMLSRFDPRSVLRGDVLRFCLVRLFLIPLLMMGALRLLHVGTMLWQVSTVLFAMPVANYAAIQAELYGGDAEFASAIVFVTTFLSLLSVPLMTILF